MRTSSVASIWLQRRYGGDMGEIHGDAHLVRDEHLAAHEGVRRRLPSQAAVEQVGVHEHRDPALEAEAISAARDRIWAISAARGRISPAGGAISASELVIEQAVLGPQVVLVALAQRVDVLAQHILHLREI